MDIHPGKVYPFYSVYLTNWEKLPIFGHFYPGRVYNILENIHPWGGGGGQKSLSRKIPGCLWYKDLRPTFKTWF